MLPSWHGMQAFYAFVKLLADPKKIHIVITSREAILPENLLNGAGSFALDKLSENDSLELLLSRVNHITNDDAQMVVSICDRNALLLNILGGFLGSRRCSIKVGCPTFVVVSCL